MTTSSLEPYTGPVIRRYPEKDGILKGFELDEYRLLTSEANGKLSKKTQVLSLPKNANVRTRKTHTDEVVANSSKISRALGLNDALCRAIAYGHDIGHVPFGHVGQDALSELEVSEFNFKHEIFGTFVAQHVENGGQGLNLSYQVLEGILHHSSGEGVIEVKGTDSPHEYNVVKLADKISYIVADIEDAIRLGLLKPSNLPNSIHDLGRNGHERTDKLIVALIKASKDFGRIPSPGEIADAGEEYSKAFEDFKKTRDYMFDQVYKKLNSDSHAKVIQDLYGHFNSDTFEYEGDTPLKQVVHPAIVIGLMTDDEARGINDDYFLSNLAQLLTMERLRGNHNSAFVQTVDRMVSRSAYLWFDEDKNIDYTNPHIFTKPDLNWKTQGYSYPQ